ncbi:MAG: hypothetical protein QXU88_01890 [Candidatus Woesearchaeota archaeon]
MVFPEKLPGWLNWIVLLIGLLYLLKDLNVAGFGWWSLNWWTVLFLVWGLAKAFNLK